jgi:hypothetical protein
MACNTVTETIDGVKYVTIQFPARQGAKILVRLTKVFGPIFKSFDVDNVTNTEVDIAAFIEKLDDDSFVQLILDLLMYTKRNGVDITDMTLDTEFAGEYLQMLKVIWFVIRANNFLGKGDIGKMVTKYFPGMQKTSTESPIEPTQNS